MTTAPFTTTKSIAERLFSCENMHICRSLARAIVRRNGEGKSSPNAIEEWDAMNMPVDPQSFQLLDNLCEMLGFANTADADRSTMPSDISSQRGCYGHISNAINAVLVAHMLPIPDEVNWCGNESRLADLFIAVKESI